MTYQSPGLLRRSALSAAAGSASSASSADSAGAGASGAAGSAAASGGSTTSAGSSTPPASPADVSPSKVVTVFSPLYHLLSRTPAAPAWSGQDLSGRPAPP